MDINFEIKKEIGKLGNSKNAPFLKIVSWNGRTAKYDLRKWGADGTPFRGISFNTDSGNKLLGLIREALATEVSVQSDNAIIYNMQNKEVPIYIVFGVFEVQGKFNKELTYMNWGNKAKYDLRGWTDEHDKCTKGISLDRDELKELAFLLETETGNICNINEETDEADNITIDEDDWKF